MRTHSISETGVDLVKTHEGFRAEPVAMAEGGWVVGYGHVRIADAGAPLNEADAAELLKLDLAPVERFVNSVVVAPITQSQYDALVSFCFSVGQTAFERSDVLRKVNAGKVVAAACAMDAWRKSSVGGESEIFDVLIKRRAAEKALFLKDAPVQAAPSVFLRAEQDHAASILGASISYGVIPAIGDAPKEKAPETPLSQRLTEILTAEPATTLVLTQVVPAGVAEEEIVTAHARPVARKMKAVVVEREGIIAPKASGLSVQTIGLSALVAFGIGLLALGAASMFGGAANPEDVLGGLVIAAPGVIAAVAGAYGLLRAPSMRYA